MISWENKQVSGMCQESSRVLGAAAWADGGLEAQLANGAVGPGIAGIRARQFYADCHRLGQDGKETGEFVMTTHDDRRHKAGGCHGYSAPFIALAA